VCAHGFFFHRERVRIVSFSIYDVEDASSKVLTTCRLSSKAEMISLKRPTTDKASWRCSPPESPISTTWNQRTTRSVLCPCSRQSHARTSLEEIIVIARVCHGEQWRISHDLAREGFRARTGRCRKLGSIWKRGVSLGEPRCVNRASTGRGRRR
jgi:hypothetical protein